MTTSSLQAHTRWVGICQFWARQSSECLLATGDGFEVSWSGGPFAFINCCSLTSPIESEEDLERRLRALLRFANGRREMWSFFYVNNWIPTEIQPRMGAILGRYRLVPAVAMTSMGCKALLPPKRPLPNLEFKRIRTTEQRLLMADLNSDAYGIPREACRATMAAGAVLSDPELEIGYLAYADGELVSTASTILIDGQFYVALVATAQEHRRKGYAEAVMRQSLEAAARLHGPHASYLHASVDGKPVYEAMGYRAMDTATIAMRNTEGQ